MTPIARIEGLSVAYPIRNGLFGGRKSLQAVSGVSLELRQGEILGLVGESGCGKSSLGKAIIRLVEPTSGKIEIAGVDFRSLRGQALRTHRSNIQMVFQDPYASLDPRMTVADILSEPLRAHGKYTTKQLEEKIASSLSRVGLRPQDCKRYPHEFSGGQRQRVAIARALILEPKIIIADEPVSSLDVSVQAQILNLLKDIQRELNLTLLFISHNLAVVKYLADRIAVMYLGKIVELAGRDEIFSQPQHPYTQALLAAVPIADPLLERQRRRVPLKGEIPSAVNPPAGCAFHTRCPLAYERCRTETPALEISADSGRKVSCFAVAKPRPVQNA